MQPLTIAGRDPGGTMIASHGRTGARALFAVLSVAPRLLPVALVCAAQLAAGGPVRADPVPETMNGVPLLPIPTFEEVGLPPFTMPTGTLSTVPDPAAAAGGSVTGGDASGDGADSIAMTTMMSQSWGEAASQNAAAVGVTMVSVAATCIMESGCNANPASNGTISGTFQMRDDTYTSMINSALARDPNLAANIVPGLAGKSDPATQSIAAAEYLRQGAVALQAANVPNPSVLDVRGYYNFGPGNASGIALAQSSAVMSDVVPLTAEQYRANGITPGVTTIGQWRASVSARIGQTAAQAPVLLGRS